MKKLTQKQKQHIKDVLKKVSIGLSVALNVIFTFILVGSLIIASKGNKETAAQTEIAPKNKYSPLNSYTSNILTNIDDIADNDILGGVYGEQVILSPYIAFRDFTYEINTYYTTSVEYYTPNSISTLSFMRSVFYDKNGTFQGTDYNFTFDLRTKDNTLPVINGYRINYIEIRPINAYRCEWWINTTRNNTTKFSRYLIMNAGHSPYGYSSSNQTLFTELFSGKYFYPKLNVYDNLQVQRYKGLIYCLSNYSINYLDLGFQSNIVKSISLLPAFKSMGYVPLSSKTGCYLMYKPTGDTGSDLSGNIFLLYGDFYYNGEVYKELRLYYSYLRQVGPSSTGATRYSFDVSINGQHYTDINIGSYCDILYLSSVVLANNMFNNSTINRPDVNVAYPVVLGSNYNYEAGSNYVNYVRNVDIYTDLNYLEGNWIVAKAIGYTGFIAFDNGTSTLVTQDSNYTLSTGLFTYTNRFYFNYDNGQPYYYVEGLENDNGIGNGPSIFTDVFIIIDNAFVGLTSLFDYAILPGGITIGILISIPLVFTIILFVIKLFKR